jgi:NADH:ubiquinone oxidoreductase subunit 6 (subunit J)
MIIEILSIGLIVSAVLALFLDEVVYSVAALSGTFLFISLIYYLNGAVYAAIFQFVVGIGTLSVLFLSGEMLGEKAQKKASHAKTAGLIGAGILLALPAIFLSVSTQASSGPVLPLGEALWNMRGIDVLVQALIILTLSLGIGIVLYERRKKQ